LTKVFSTTHVYFFFYRHWFFVVAIFYVTENVMKYNDYGEKERRKWVISTI